MDDPNEVKAIAKAAESPAFLHALDVLTAPRQRVRGCRVDPARPNLQALQNILGWTQGGYNTRPAEAIGKQKHLDSMQVLLQYRQPPPPLDGQPPRVAMYDYICDTLFGVPMRPVGMEVELMEVEDLEGRIVTPMWVEADWEHFRASGVKRPGPVFSPNRYPYQLPSRSTTGSAHEFQRQTQHWILWYFHYPNEPIANPTDEAIDSDIRRKLLAVIREEDFEAVDYIWYRNPGMSVPEVFHVQVFWIVPEE